MKLTEVIQQQFIASPSGHSVVNSRRPPKPRTPEDCPACRATLQPVRPPISTPLQPYSQLESPRGRRKRIATAGFACPNSDCRYYGITDNQIHVNTRSEHGSRVLPYTLPRYTKVYSRT